MPIIRPVSDLRNKFSKISETCHEAGEPVFLTKNGQGDMVVMSVALYDQLQARLELYEKLAQAEAESAGAANTLSHEEMMQSLRNRLDV